MVPCDLCVVPSDRWYLDFESACAMLSSVIAELFNEHLYVLDDERITEYQKKDI